MVDDREVDHDNDELRGDEYTEDACDELVFIAYCWVTQLSPGLVKCNIGAYISRRARRKVVVPRLQELLRWQRYFQFAYTHVPILASQIAFHKNISPVDFQKEEEISELLD